MNIDKYRRSLIAQFRFEILALQLEIGRYRGIPIDESLRMFCTDNEIEDEFHSIMISASYVVFRNELFQKIGNIDSNFNGMDNFDKFMYL